MKLTRALIFGITFGSTNAAVLSVNSGTGKYITINDAVKAASSGDVILVNPGVYKEKIVVDKDNITLKGSSFPSTDPAQNGASIEAANYAMDTDDDSATLFITGSNFKLYNINITNSAPSASQAAVAISSRGTNNGFYTVGVHGIQGTFYAHTGTGFVARSYIQGGVDVVYGRTGNFWFQGVKLGATGLKGMLSAQGRQAISEDGYFVFDQAKIIIGKNPEAGTKGTVFLGRAWGDYARAVFQNSNLGNVISDAGWIAYNSTQNTKHFLLGEYQNSNSGNIMARVAWARALSNPTDISTVLPGYKGWVDRSYVGVSAP